MQTELTCPLCSKEYKEGNLPRLLVNCGHTYCQKCLDTLTVLNSDITTVTCPEDSIETTVSSEGALPKNFALLKIIEAKKLHSSKDENSFDVSKINRADEFQEDEDTKNIMAEINSGRNLSPINSDDHIQETKVELCLLHHKPLDVLCTLDKQRICSKCAIFGKHKGHDFKSLEEIEGKNKEYYAHLLQIFEAKSLFMERMTNQTNFKELVEIMRTKCNRMKKDISEKYKKLVDHLAKCEKKNFKSIEELMAVTEQKIKKSFCLDSKLIREYNAWEQNSYEKIKALEGDNFEGKIELFFKGQETVAKGNEITAAMNSLEMSSFSKIETYIAELGFISNDSIVDLSEEYIEVVESMSVHKESAKNSSPKCHPFAGVEFDHIQKISSSWSIDNDMKSCCSPQINWNEESLLDIEPQETLDSRDSHNLICLKENKILPIKLERSFKIDSKKEINRAGQNTCRKSGVMKDIFEKGNSTTIIPMNESRVFNKDKVPNVTTLKKKIKSIKVPEKYEKILQGIINDSLEIIDLSNAELGDAVILQICELIRSSARIKVIKLIRNKLTDQVIPKMLAYLPPMLLTLNLSQNSLTQNTLITLTEMRNMMPALKSITLSQNKIIERKHKVAIDKLRKLDLTVSV